MPETKKIKISLQRDNAIIDKLVEIDGNIDLEEISDYAKTFLTKVAENYL